MSDCLWPAAWSSVRKWVKMTPVRETSTNKAGITAVGIFNFVVHMACDTPSGNRPRMSFVGQGENRKLMIPGFWRRFIDHRNGSQAVFASCALFCHRRTARPRILGCRHQRSNRVALQRRSVWQSAGRTSICSVSSRPLGSRICLLGDFISLPLR